jgi:16S rRNA C967 or C1407 C5-methylase (RsmB/RsmF family)/NOL1/NOP2/fmu family ribosome biogenesis protein
MKTRASLPKEFEQRLREQLGDSFTDFEKSLAQPSPVSIRLHPKKTISLGDESVPWSTFGKYLKERPVFTLDPAFHAGAYYVQEASSMFLEQGIQIANHQNKPLRVLDLCAAPGGKSTHLLSLLPPDSVLVANEVIRSRAAILSENIQKWGYHNVVVTNNDPQDFAALTGYFDVIVVDAPCSGEGLFRKDAEAMQEWSPANVELCSKRQRRILADVWPALKTGGVLLYSTCTYNEFENEENLKWLNRAHALEPIELKIDKTWGIETVKVDNLSGYRFYPHRVKGEGFFLSAIQKSENQPVVKLKHRRSLLVPSKKIVQQLSAWTTIESPGFFTWNEVVFGFPAELLNDLEFLKEHLKIVHAGTAFATIKHDKLIPEHALALSANLNREQFQTHELKLENALRYLKKEPVEVGTLHKGFALITYNTVGLGWINVLDNRTNNLYPKAWRIRMAV